MLFNLFKTKKQLYKEIEELKAELISTRAVTGYCSGLYAEYKKQTVHVKKLSAYCISLEDKGDYTVSKQTICYELANQLMPYIKFEHYKIADGLHPNEMKHFGTIQVIENTEDTL